MDVLGNTEDVEWKKVHLETARKQNELLDLQIEMQKVELEMRKVL